MHAPFKLSRVVAIVALVLAVGLSTTACGKYSIGNLRSLMAFKEANQLYGGGKFPQAIEAYQKALSHNPDMGVVYFFLGNSYDNMYKPSRQGEPENDAYLVRAVENYLKATEIIKDEDVQGPEIRKLSYEYLIAAYGVDKIDDFEAAEPIAQKLISLEPNEPGNYLSLGKLYEDQGRYDEAEAMFRKGVEVRPNEALGYMVLAGYFNRQGDFEQTMQAWEDRAKVEPNNPEAFQTIGQYYWDKAFNDFRLSTALKREYIAKGIAAEDAALALHGDYIEALTFKNILLRLQANMEKDTKKQKALIDEADILRNRAMELQKAQGAGGGGN
ncbi:MAG: tetratricopeptide repeat protein [Acidobacteria bacterium]|jgi:tetratricopeptide (TPR) repeat protein|nr:tetratricopeptide repeat protein [Acidobacteriota bacterium]